MTEDRAAYIRTLRESGMSWKAIGRIIGIDGDTAHRIADPKYRESRNVKSRDRERERYRKQATRIAPRNDADVAARLAEIPPDTRDLTARLCGDPLPGRSALDRRGSMALYRLERVA